jgi:hypothetical protein
MSNGQLQLTVGRAYTTGFQGQIVRFGPQRSKMARILSATTGTDPAASTNRMSRVFGWSADESIPGGTTLAADAPGVVLGGTDYFGILGHPERYALYGQAGNSLAPSIDLPQGMEGEFFDMVTGMVMEVFNPNTAAETFNYGDTLAYVPNNITTENNPLVLPYGALVWVPAGGSVPTGMLAVPGNPKIVTSAVSVAASADGAPVSARVIVQI